MNKILLTICLLINMNAIAQIQPVKQKPVPLENLSDFDVSKDRENGQDVFKGIFAFTDCQKDTSFTWLRKGMDAYQPDAQAMTYLEKHLRSYDIRVFMGTWCDDSHELIPKFYKVMLGINYMPMNNLVMRMDRDKTTKEQYMTDVKEYKVTLLPTIILINSKGVEAGRIAETADKSIEADLVKIIEQDIKKG